MRVGRAEGNRSEPGLLWERCGRLELTVRVGGKLRAAHTRAIRDLVESRAPPPGGTAGLITRRGYLKGHFCVWNVKGLSRTGCPAPLARA